MENFFYYRRKIGGDSSVQLNSLLVSPAEYSSSAWQVPVTTYANASAPTLNGITLSPSLPYSDLQSYMLGHTPVYGALAVNDWDVSTANFNYTLIFNDSYLHSLPIMVNALNNAKYPPNNNNPTDIT